MSKRFGRNQKRKMRAEIEMHKDQIDYLQKRAEYLYEKGKQNADSVEIMYELFGKYFIAFPPESEFTNHYVIDRGKFPLSVYKHHDTKWVVDDQIVSDTVNHFLNLDVVKLDSFEEFMGGMKHTVLKLKLGGDYKQFYAISPMAMSQMNEQRISQLILSMCKKLISDILSGYMRTD